MEHSQMGSFSQHYLHAPVVEAVLDMQVLVPTDVKVQDLAILGERESGSYPLRQGHFSIRGEFEISVESFSTTGERQQTGFVFISEDQKQVFQARIDGFTFSRLAPYRNWGSFEAEALRLWERYREVARPVTLTRLAVRFINRIELPDTKAIDVEDYIRTHPQVSPDLPASLEGYLMQLQFAMPQYAARLTLIQSIVSDAQSGRLGIILDNDIVKELAAKIEADDFSDELRSWLLELKAAKNDAFEASITERTREMITR